MNEFDLDTLVPIGYSNESKTGLSLLEEYTEYEWITPREVASSFGVHVKTLARWRRNGKLDKVRKFKTPGGHVRYFRQDIQKILEDNEDRITE